MLEWFTEQDTTIKVAIIGACGTVLAAIIAGIFNLFNKKSKTKENATHMVNQTATSQNNTQIEVQNNYYEMTPEQACQTAINLFMQNFPKLENIARETAEKRASEFCKEAIQKIIKKVLTILVPLLIRMFSTLSMRLKKTMQDLEQQKC